jgi:hypothetical protein
MTPVRTRLKPNLMVQDAVRSDYPQRLRPEIARVIEALARAAVRREHRHCQAIKEKGQ